MMMVRFHGFVAMLLLVLISSAFTQADPPADKRTSVHENKLIARRVIAAFNERDYSAVDSLVTKDFVNHAIQTVENPPTGREGVKAVIRRIESAFPDFKMEILDLIAEGDRVAFRVLFTGTHKGSYMGIEPTGKKVSFQAMHILRISGGQIAEHWSVRDDLTRLRQIGKFPQLTPSRNGKKHPGKLTR